MSCIYLDNEISCQICFSDILCQLKLSLGWADIDGKESVSISKQFAFVLNKVCLVVLS